MTTPTDPDSKRFRSATIREGTIRATTRSFLHALGQDDEDIARPHIGVFHTGGEISEKRMPECAMVRPSEMETTGHSCGIPPAA